MFVTQEFELPKVNGLVGVPKKVVEAALGGYHQPVVPHRQRLLVAASKATEAEAPKGKLDNDESPEGKAAKPKPKAKAKTKAKASPDAPTTESKGKRPKYEDTIYNIERKKFQAAPLDV